jgi:CBS domain-containing protein
MENLDTVLARYPPFARIDPAQLRAALVDAQERSFERGDSILVEDGPPSSGLWVILGGSMDLVHDGEVIQVLEPGECFGHPSLLTGMAPAFTVRAREPSRCLLFAPEASRRVLGTVAGATYVAASMRNRLTGAGHTVHALRDLGTMPVSAIMRSAAFCDADQPLREAARRLGDAAISGLLVRLGADELGIVTDADVRAAVADPAVSFDAPVRAIARAPVPTVSPDQLAVEAAVDMLAAGAEHLVVLEGAAVRGMLSAGDLLGLDARSPIALRHIILGAADEEALVRATGQLHTLFLLLMRAGVPPDELGRVLSLQYDAITTRLIDFSIWRHQAAPAAWAWLHLGSAARREFTLASDQDNALAYATPDSGEEQTVDAYFQRLGSEVNQGLVRCGIGLDNNGVLAGKPLWRMSKDRWLRTFGECLTQPDESHLIRASVSFDFRPSAGGLAVVPELTEYIRDARRHPQFMRLMARTANGYPVALGFRGQLATGRGDDPPGRLDLKHGAIIPLVNLVRFHALANGITISPTLDRIDAVVNVGGLAPDVADGLAEAFGVITRRRFEHHAAQINAGLSPDNLVDPGELTPIARTDLREALQVVRRAQRRLGAWSPPDA